VPGYNVEQIVRRLRARGLGLEPDAIVYGYTLNDPQAFSIEAEALRRLRAGVDERFAAKSGIEAWLGRSHLYRVLRHRAAARASLAALRADMPDDPAYGAAQGGDPAGYVRAIHREGEAAARLERGLDDLAAIARERGVPVLVAVFPLFGDPGADPLDDVRAGVAAASERRGLAALDLAPAFAAASRALASPLRADFLHPDATGHRVAAIALFGWICRAAWLPPGTLDCATPLADATDAAIARAVAPVLASGPTRPP
jgi:hypothetical protein